MILLLTMFAQDLASSLGLVLLEHSYMFQEPLSWCETNVDYPKESLWSFNIRIMTEN